MGKVFLQHIDLNQNEIRNILLHILATAPISPLEGQFYYNSTDKTIYFYNGTVWVNLGATGGGSIWTVNGSDIYYNTGHVGIGTDAPGDMLQVLGQVNNLEIGPSKSVNVEGVDIRVSGGDLRMGDINPGGTLGGALFQLFSNSNTSFPGQIYFDAGNNASSAIIFRTGVGGTVNEVMRILKDGNVGIGTNNPGAKLGVDGTVKFIQYGAGTNTGTATYALQVDASGNVIEGALGGGGGAVDSVNTQTGVVVLDADDISDAATTNKFTTAGNITKLGHITVTQAVDLDTMESNIATNNSKVSNANHTGDVTGSTALTIANNAVTYAKLQQSSVGFTILGKATTGAGNFAQIVAGTDGVLRRSGSGNIAFGSLVTNNYSNASVTLAKLANVATDTIFYRKTAGTGAPEVQTLATLKTDLGLTGTNSGDLWVESGSDIYYNTGNVGIGKTNPSYPLDVLGNVKIDGTLQYSGQINASIIGLSSFLSPSFAAVLILDAVNARVGIGTFVPTSTLDVGGVLTVSDLTATPTRLIGATAGGVLGEFDTLADIGTPDALDKILIQDNSAGGELKTVDYSELGGGGEVNLAQIYAYNLII